MTKQGAIWRLVSFCAAVFLGAADTGANATDVQDSHVRNEHRVAYGAPSIAITE